MRVEIDAPVPGRAFDARNVYPVEVLRQDMPSNLSKANRNRIAHLGVLLSGRTDELPLRREFLYGCALSKRQCACLGRMAHRRARVVRHGHHSWRWKVAGKSSPPARTSALRVPCPAHRLNL